MNDQVIQNELRPEERLLWSGQPRGGIQFSSADIFLIPFSLLWGGFAIFWEAAVLYSILFARGRYDLPPLAMRIIFPLFGIPFVLVGLYLVFGRFIVDARRREKTYYGVTNQRILIVSQFFGRKIESLTLKNLPGLTLSEKSNATGTITFGSSSPLAMFGSIQWPGYRPNQRAAFEMVAEVRQVYDTIQSAQQSAG